MSLLPKELELERVKIQLTSTIESQEPVPQKLAYVDRNPVHLSFFFDIKWSCRYHEILKDTFECISSTPRQPIMPATEGGTD